MSPGNCSNPENNDNTYNPHLTPENAHLRVWENKYELDSIASFLKISRKYKEATDDLSIFDSNWLNAVKIVY